MAWIDFVVGVVAVVVVAFIVSLFCFGTFFSPVGHNIHQESQLI